MPPHYQQSLQPVEVVDYLEEEEEEAILFRYQYKIIPDMDDTLETEQSAFSPMKNMQSGIRFDGISNIFFFFSE